MKRRVISAEDVHRYRWLLEIDEPFRFPGLPRGFEYEEHIDGVLETIWTRAMVDTLGIDLDRFREITKVDVIQQKRNLLDVALTHGPLPTSRAFLSKMDLLLAAEHQDHSPQGVMAPALRILPTYVSENDGVQVWCGAATALPCDVALTLADLDLTSKRVKLVAEASHRAHALAGPRLRTDCVKIREYFENEFLPGSVALTRGYFAPSKYIVHVIPPCVDDGVWKHSVSQLKRCYAGFWELATLVGAQTISIQYVPLGRTCSIMEVARKVLLDQIANFRASSASPIKFLVAAHTIRDALSLSSELNTQRLDRRFLRAGGFLPGVIAN